MPTQWMVGIDPWNLSAGAAAFARWIASRAPRERFVGAHVVASDIGELFARVDPKAKTLIPPYIHRLIDPLRTDPTFNDVAMIVHSSADDGLIAEAAERGCGGLIIGRRKPVEAKVIVRLGPVARRLLRSLPTPVVVVPPDMTEFSDGPVLVATNLDEAGVAAARFGATIARTLDLDLLVTAVAVPPGVALYMPGEDWTPVLEEGVRRRTTKLAEWVEKHDLAHARHSVVEGDVAARLLEVAHTAGASMIVVGSRRLSALDRVFTSSVGSELAASAPIPVVVVPPTWTA